MSTPLDTTTPAITRDTAAPDRDLAQLGLAGLLVVVGLYTFYDASTLRVGFGDPVGPRVFPYVIGAVTAALGVLLPEPVGRHLRQIAEALGISVKTVEVHRARAMEKMDVTSVAELVQVTLHGKNAA